jgi:hypothetical protein
VPVQGRVNIDRTGAVPVPYLGVLNTRGRLNVAYTPGKQKIEESWALKPLEVLYLDAKSVADGRAWHACDEAQSSRRARRRLSGA